MHRDGQMVTETLRRFATCPNLLRLLLGLWKPKKCFSSFVLYICDIFSLVMYFTMYCIPVVLFFDLVTQGNMTDSILYSEVNKLHFLLNIGFLLK